MSFWGCFWLSKERADPSFLLRVPASQEMGIEPLRLPCQVVPCLVICFSFLTLLFFPFLCLCFRTSLFFSGFERCCSLPVAPSGSQPHSRLELRASGTLWPSVCVTTRSNVLRCFNPCYPHYSLFIICTTGKTSFILALYWFSSSPVVLVV